MDYKIMYEMLFNEMLDGFALHEIVCDENGKPIDYKYLAVNPAFEKITGLEGSAIIGKRVLEILPNTELHWIRTYGDVALSGKPAWFEQYSVALDKHFEVKAFSPEPGKFVTIFVDITERKNNEKKLMEEKKNAEFANLTKNRFLANMSHEIRTPINSITGLLTLLDLTGLDDEQKKYLTLAKNATDVLLHLIDDVLDLTKIEAGKLELKQEKFSLHNTIFNTVMIMRPIAEAKKVNVLLHFGNSVPYQVIGDVSKFTQVINNILGNAVKFTDSGLITVTVESHLKVKKQKWLIEMCIEDTGIGISDSTLEKLFTPFKQGDSSSTKKYGGTGLGLSISKNLIQMMGGDITVKSHIDSGSRFRFSFEFGVVDDA
jgi:PAS domain S-box-containing protein